MPDVDIAPLIAALDTDDLRERRRASEAVLAAGPAAASALMEALRTGPPRVRKAAAFLLARCDRSAEAVDALAAALLDDPEPKVRQNAAVSLGRLRAVAAEEALVMALAKETVAWVRPSVLLALGATGGASACAALESTTATNDAEREALRKARDRCLTRRPAVEWRRDRPWLQALTLDVPVGLERIAVAEASERGLPPLAVAGAGQLRCPPGLAPWEGLLELRCAYGVRLPGGRAMGRWGEVRPTTNDQRPTTGARSRGLSPGEVEELAAVIGRLIEESRPLREWREWVATEEEALRYRLALVGTRLRRDELRRVLEAARAAGRPLGLVDSPSSYSIELTVVVEEDGIRLSVKPCFVDDTRFAYREKDVGAAIHPVVGACLARLVRTSPPALPEAGPPTPSDRWRAWVPWEPVLPPGIGAISAGTVLDPTCGSGTLLIERALLDDRARLVGLDISPTAVAAARANVRAAGLQKRIRIVRGDAADPDAWPECDEVLANLPFGLRTRRPGGDPARLYAAILANTAAKLRPGGRALLFTANRKAFEPHLTAQRDRLKIVDRVRVLSGGLRATAWVLTTD